MIPVLGVACAYLLGSVPFGFLVGKYGLGVDVRRHGSGNIGATNVWRLGGAGWGLATGLLDLGKGWLGVSLMNVLNPDGSLWWQVGAALAAIAGHNWTIWLRFRGGRGVLTACGAFLGLAWLPVLAAAGVFALVYGASKYVSLGSMLAAVSLVAFVILIPGEWQSTPVQAAAAIAAAAIVLRHIPNMRRLAAGKELRFGAGKGKDKRKKE